MGVFGRKSRKELIEENARLQAEVDFMMHAHRPNVCTIERNVHKIQSCIEVPFSIDIPEECIKRKISENILEYLQPFIEYDFMDGKNGDKIFKGNLYVSTGDRRNG